MAPPAARTKAPADVLGFRGFYWVKRRKPPEGGFLFRCINLVFYMAMQRMVILRSNYTVVIRCSVCRG